MIVSLQLITIALAATVAARPPNDWGNGKKTTSTVPSKSTTSSAAASTTAAPTNPPQPQSPSSKFFPFWPFRGFNNKCFDDFKDCRRNAESSPGSCASTYAACIGTRASSRMPVTSVTSAPGSMPTFRLPHPLLPPLSHIGKHHGRVRKCNEAYWACRNQASSSQSSCYSDLGTCLASIGASSTSAGVPSSTSTASSTSSSVVAPSDSSGGDQDDDDDDDDSVTVTADAAT
ncbi:hypothetical protein ACHAPT_006253 [Fusarium lateritium]